MNPVPSNYSLFFKTLRFEGININMIVNREEGAG